MRLACRYILVHRNVYALITRSRIRARKRERTAVEKNGGVAVLPACGKFGGSAGIRVGRRYFHNVERTVGMRNRGVLVDVGVAHDNFAVAQRNHPGTG